MKRRLLLPLPIVLAVLFAPLQTASDTAYACNCGLQTMEERVEGSELAFTGKIVRFEGAWPVFAVKRYYKGSSYGEVMVSDPVGGGACSYFDDRGLADDEREHLVFVWGSEYGYSTSLCAGNASSDSPDYDASVAEVEALTGPGQPPAHDEPAEDASTPWAIILPLAFAIPLAVLLVPSFLRRRSGR